MKDPELRDYEWTEGHIMNTSPERLTEIREWKDEWQKEQGFRWEMVADLLAIIDDMAAKPLPMEESHDYIMQLKRERDEAINENGDLREALIQATAGPAFTEEMGSSDQ